MKKSTLNLSIRATRLPQRLREEIHERGDRGAMTTEMVVLALGLFAVATTAVGLLTAWVISKLAGLN